VNRRAEQQSVGRIAIRHFGFKEHAEGIVRPPGKAKTADRDSPLRCAVPEVTSAPHAQPLVSEGWRELDERLARIIAHLPGSRDCALESRWPSQHGMSAVHCISAGGQACTTANHQRSDGPVNGVKPRPTGKSPEPPAHRLSSPF
jgi:hypothetical protein